MDGTFICKTCDSDYDMLDTNEFLIPEPIFVSIELLSQAAIIDTRTQEVYVRADTIRKAQLLTELLNWHFSQKAVKGQLANYFNHE